MPPPPLIGMTIKRARERLQLTQAQLGQQVGASQKTIDNWEHDRRYPRNRIGALEHVLGISLTAARPAPPPRISAALMEAIRRDLPPADQQRVIDAINGPAADAPDGGHQAPAG